MQKYMDDVAAFHAAVGDDLHPAAPTVPVPQRRDLRVSLIDEEVNQELFPAIHSGNLISIADALADSAYVIVGTALNYGIPLGCHEVNPALLAALRADELQMTSGQAVGDVVNGRLLPALRRGELDKIEEASVDAMHAIIATAMAYGIPFDRVWDAVHTSNMAKVDPATGKALKRADGKVQKPPGWQPPDIAGALMPLAA